MKHTIKKSELINTMNGKTKSAYLTETNSGKSIKLSEEQFTRMLENFGDGDLELSNPTAQSMVTQSADDYYMDTESASELDEDLNDFLGNMNEEGDDEEDLDEMWGALAKIAAGAAGAVAAEKLSDKYLEEKDDMMESIKKTYKLIRERIKIERPGGVTLMEFNSKAIGKAFLNESQDEWRGHNPGASAASGIENIINSIKKGYDFLKDSKTRKQIENTLTKINNFMTYTGELVGSGGSQRAPRTYDQVANPLPWPELEQSAEDEAFEDIDDEINITEAYSRIGVRPRNIPTQYKFIRRLSEAEGDDLQLSYEITAPKTWYMGVGQYNGCDYSSWLRKQPNWQKGGEAVSLYTMKPSCPIHEGMFDDVAAWANWMWGGYGNSEAKNKIYKAISKQMKVDKARYMKEKAAGTTYSQLRRAGIINNDGTPGPNSKEGKVASLELSREDLVNNIGNVAYYVNKAVKGLGTDEDLLFRHLSKLKTYADDMGMNMSDIVKRLSSIYAEKYGESLMDALEGDLSGGDLRKAMGMLNESNKLNITEAYRRVGVRARNIPRQYKRRLTEVQGINAERIAKELHDSMKGVGTNERRFWGIIQPTGRQGLTTDEMADVREAFKNLYDESLCEWIKGDFSGGDLRKALNAVGC